MTNAIGFIGLGIMGRPMAMNLLRAGHRLVVHDTDRERVHALAELGAREGYSPRKVAEEAEVVITMLPDSPDVEAVAFGPEGVLEGMSAGGLYIDMSTISPMVTARVAEVGAVKGIASWMPRSAVGTSELRRQRSRSWSEVPKKRSSRPFPSSRRWGRTSSTAAGMEQDRSSRPATRSSWP